MTTPLTPKDWELLSAYLDGQLSDAEKRQVQDLLALRPDLGQGLDELRRTRAVLRAAPSRRAPRNFTLTPAMVQKPRRRLTWGWAPSFGFASALATVLLVLSFFFHLPVQALSNTAAPAAAPAPLTARNSAGSEATPPIILWQDNGQGATGMGGMGGAPASSSPAAGIEPTAAPNFSAQSAPTDTPPAAALVRPNLAPESTTTPEATAAAPAAEKSAPPLAAAPLATTAAASGAAATAALENGPILGIAPQQDRGKLIVPTQGASDAYAVHAIEEPSTWPWVQTGLAGVALVCAALAIWLWRRARH